MSYNSSYIGEVKITKVFPSFSKKLAILIHAFSRQYLYSYRTLVEVVLGV